jgi:putative SOS response-associated peptidase YedK
MPLAGRQGATMCGKFTQMLSWRGLSVRDALLGTFGLGPVETVTPMRFADVIALDDEGRRKSVRMRWGLVPPGARDPAAVKPHIHARAETIDVKPTFRDAFAQRRGLVAVTSFNEGREITPTKTEQHVLTPLDGKPIAIAVVWESWSAPQSPSLLSFTMITVPPNALIGTITDRMPALIDETDWQEWLGETPAAAEDRKLLLRPSARGLAMQLAEKPKAKRGQAELF